MIKTLKQTTLNLFYWIKKKLIRFKKWIIVLICGSAILAAPLIPPQLPDVALENIQAKYKASEIKGKYRLEKTAFILDAIDENAIQAEVGNKNLDKFTPELTLRKWDDEVNFKVKYKHSEKEKDQKVDIENEKIKWKGNETEVHYYDIKKGELLHDKVLESDVYEVEVVLLEKPDTNIVEFDIETKGLAFYYQPELTQEEIDEGAERPENIIGSYAVYHESKQGDYSPMGLKNYRAGKAFHIYRPKIIDSAGTEIWGELNIENNLLTVTIPQDFLDNAVYPVRHAAGLTIGYTTKGNSEYNCENFTLGARFVSEGTAGNAESITVYVYRSDNSAAAIKTCLYDNSLNLMDYTDITVPALNDDWVSGNLTDEDNIAASTNYMLVISTISNIDGTNDIYYDSGIAGQFSLDIVQDYASMPENPWTPSHPDVTDYKMSIYATYTAGGGAERRMFLIE